ncbi:MAG: MerR family transcriptional regulator [Thermoanaerobaculia bacterium]
MAAETGMTARGIRYYEEVGLLEPAARSDGDYRLYDASDLDRLQSIRKFRDAGFSLAQIGQMLEDDAARERNRERFASTNDPTERRLYLTDAAERVERQIVLLEEKAAGLAVMIDEAQTRLGRIRTRIVELDASEPAAVPTGTGTRRRPA